MKYLTCSNLGVGEGLTGFQVEQTLDCKIQQIMKYAYQREIALSLIPKEQISLSDTKRTNTFLADEKVQDA